MGVMGNLVSVKVGDDVVVVDPDDYVDDFQHLPVFCGACVGQNSSKFCAECGEHFDRCLCDPLAR